MDRIHVYPRPAETAPLTQAVQRDDLYRAACLIRAGADPDLRGRGGPSPLEEAAKNRGLQWTDFLLAVGARATDRALWLAAGWNPDPEVTRLLLAEGADPNAQVNIMVRQQALHQAAFANPDIVADLIRAGADLEARDAAGWTPLFGAVAPIAIDPGVPYHRLRHPNVLRSVQLLLGFGADPNAQDNFGRTALHVALRSWGTALEWDPDLRLAVADALVTAGAQTGLRDKAGQTAADLAAESGIELP